MASALLAGGPLVSAAWAFMLSRRDFGSKSWRKIGGKRPIFGKSLRELANRGYNEPFRLEHIWHDIFLVARKEIVACT